MRPIGPGVADAQAGVAALALGRRAVGQVGPVRIRACARTGQPRARQASSSAAIGAIAPAAASRRCPALAPKPPGSTKSRCMSMTTSARAAAARTGRRTGRARPRPARSSGHRRPVQRDGRGRGAAAHVRAQRVAVGAGGGASRRRCGLRSSPTMRSDSSQQLVEVLADQQHRGAAVARRQQARRGSRPPRRSPGRTPGWRRSAASTSPASSRASTARCTLPPDSAADRRALALRLDAVLGDPARARARASAPPAQPAAALPAARWSKSRSAMLSADAAASPTQALRSGSSGRLRTLQAPVLRARGADRARPPRGPCRRARALADQRLDQLALAVARDAGDADDLAAHARSGSGRAPPACRGRPAHAGRSTCQRASLAPARRRRRAATRRRRGAAASPIIACGQSRRARSSATAPLAHQRAAAQHLTSSA